MKFLIWSNEHKAWWGPNWNGYTPFRYQAGVYHQATAISICRDANRGQNINDLPNEMMFPVDTVEG
jgi:hypothetical protein